MKVPPPPYVWVAYCAYCGTPFIATSTKQNALNSTGCPNECRRRGAGGFVELEPTRAARYVLAPALGKERSLRARREAQ